MLERIAIVHANALFVNGADTPNKILLETLKKRGITSVYLVFPPDEMERDTKNSRAEAMCSTMDLTCIFPSLSPNEIINSVTNNGTRKDVVIDYYTEQDFSEISREISGSSPIQCIQTINGFLPEQCLQKETLSGILSAIKKDNSRYLRLQELCGTHADYYPPIAVATALGIPDTSFDPAAHESPHF